MALPREGKRKSNRDRKNPRMADIQRERRQAVNAARGHQIFMPKTKTYVHI